MPAASRRLVLIAAAEPTGDPMLVWRAAEQLGVDESAASAVEAEGLLDLGARLVFRHPLVRSAIYRAASPEERREAHRALAQATDTAVDPDRHAWHRAQATARPDEDIAAELERSAGTSGRRGAVLRPRPRSWSARPSSASIQQPVPAARSVAAEAKRQAGALDAALALATIAEQGPLDESSEHSWTWFERRSRLHRTAGATLHRSCSRRRSGSSRTTSYGRGRHTSTRSRPPCSPVGSRRVERARRGDGRARGTAARRALREPRISCSTGSRA